MSYSTAMMMLLAVSACADRAAPDGIPSVVVDSVAAGPGAQLVSEDLHPCGYDSTFDYPAVVGSPAGHDHTFARISYDARGLDVLEAAVDDRDAFRFSYATDYDSMGNPVHFVDKQVDVPTDELWLVYDSFGRLVRYSADQDGDGSEDWVATYTYGSGRDRTGSHLVLPARTSDRAYHYDNRGRLIELDQDFGPDGVVDEKSLYHYDDAARVMTMTMTDPTGRVLQTVTTRYDDDNHIVSSVDTSIRNKGMTPQTVTDSYVYASGQLVSQLTSVVTGTVEAPGALEFTLRYDWHYDSCR